MRLRSWMLWVCIGAVCIQGALTLAIRAKPIEYTTRSIEFSGGEREGREPDSRASPSIASTDTTWIADWSFDGSAGACDASGWETRDTRIENDGKVYWSIGNAFQGTGGIVGQAAILGDHNPCWVLPDGYGNNWYQGIRIEYSGAGFLSFDFLIDSEAGYDYLGIETDEGCASFDLVDYYAEPWATSRNFRSGDWVADGLNLSGRVDSIALPDFGSTETHCVYIVFESDNSYSPADGLQGSTLGAAVVIDNIELVGVDSPLNEDFEGTLDPAVSFVNMHDTAPFGLWARLFPHATDNDLCTENNTCSWIFSDTTLTATDPAYDFGPGGFVTRPRLDNSIISPWVNLRTEPPGKILLTCRAFGGTDLCDTGLNLLVSVRGRTKTGTSPSDSVICTSDWRGWRLGYLHHFDWRTFIYDLTDSIDSDWNEIQVRLRVGNFHCVGACPCTVPSGPGPYLDRVRIGRLDWCGPRFSNTNGPLYAQDGFPTTPDSVGSYPVPSGERFGTCAFSAARDVSYITGANFIPGDSITVEVVPQCDTAEVNSVRWYGAIVAGPHVGKAPPPLVVGANGFFEVPAEMNPWGHHYVDLDDDYFRGGDVVRFFWAATDANGGFTSFPPGLASLPSSIAEAELETSGLFEVNFLPTIAWDPGYLARIAADPFGKLDPTPSELANSTQANCILYAQQVDAVRRSGEANRTAFMYTLDRLGYEGHYDVYDLAPGRENQLGGRATVSQVTGYQLIVYDTGNQPAFPGSGSCFTPLLPDSIWGCLERVNQARWFREWLSAAPLSEAGRATLWLLGSNIVEERGSHPLLANDMGVTYVSNEQGVSDYPDVQGQTSVTWASGSTSDFSGDLFALEAGCPTFWDYDAIEANGSAIVTHRFATGTTVGDGAVVVNTDPNAHWNTIMMSFAWADIRDPAGVPGAPERALVDAILSGVMAPDCQQSPNPTDVLGRDNGNGLPLATVLHPNMPNPFNPTTTIRFDLAADAHVELRIYDVAGRLVRTLVNGPMGRKRHAVVWDGMDDAGVPVSSGIYFYRLEAGDFTDSRKMVVVR